MFFSPKHESILIRLLCALLALGVVHGARADAYDTMRVNWFNNLTGGTSYDATDSDVKTATNSLSNTANGYWTILKNTKPFTTTPFSDIPLGSNSDNITDVYSRLQTMSLAYWAIGGSLYQSAALKADLISTLDWLNTNVYNASTKQYGNWFTFNIGTPLNLNNITILLYDSLTSTEITNYMNAINHFTPTPTTVSTSGANCAWCTSIVGLRGVIVKDSTKIAAASAQFSALTAYVTNPDGFYTDGSYIGHGSLSYNGGYGFYMLQQLADGYYLFNPTALSPLPASKRAIVYGWVTNSYQSLMYQGKIPYYSIGREISRGPSDGRGEPISSTVAEIATGDTSAAATPLLAFAKNVFGASGSNYSGLGGMGAVIRMKSLMSNTAIPAAVDPIGTRIFSVMDKATSIQNGWSTSLAYHSPRTASYESINGENLKGWHQSDGMAYLDDADWNQYNGTFWATVNAQRLPGTTVTTGVTPTQGQRNVSTFAGGADLGGLYGAVGFTLQPGNGQTLVANKAWFIFDDEEVCLGSGITSTDGVKVETIIENRKLNAAGNNLLTIGGAAQPTTLPWSSTVNGVSWMHLAGSVSGADIGYYFPSRSTNLDFTRESRMSSWSAIGTGSTASVTDTYLTVGDSHGVSPSGANYAYVLLPNYSVAQVAAYAAAPVATVLENDADVSAARDAKLGATGAVFWQDSSASVATGATPAFISSDKKAVVMVQDAGNGQVLVSVSDPTQANTAGINVEIGRAIGSIISTDTGISVSQLSPTIKFSVATSGAIGKTFHAVFGTSAPAAPQIPVSAVFASADDGDVPSSTLDNNYNTRWSAQGDGQWIQYDLPVAYQVSSVAIAFYGGTTRTAPFDVQTSLDGTRWTTALSYAVSSGTTNALQSFDLPAESWGSHVRIIGHGNSQGTGWNSLTEVQLTGSTTVASYTDYAALNFSAAQQSDPTISGALASPESDGVTNLLKYSQGLAPLTNVSGTTGGLPSVQNVNGYLSLTFIRLKNATDLVYTPQVSGDMNNWQAGSAYMTQVSATDLDATRQQIVVQGNTPIASGGAGFMRLTVTQSTSSGSTRGITPSNSRAYLTSARAPSKKAVSSIH